MVMIVAPAICNAFQFWVADLFLQKKGTDKSKEILDLELNEDLWKRQNQISFKKHDDAKVNYKEINIQLGQNGTKCSNENNIEINNVN